MSNAVDLLIVYCFVRTIVRVFVQISITEGLGVATNIDIDKVLIEDAMKAGGYTTKLMPCLKNSADPATKTGLRESFKALVCLPHLFGPHQIRRWMLILRSEKCCRWFATANPDWAIWPIPTRCCPGGSRDDNNDRSPTIDTQGKTTTQSCAAGLRWQTQSLPN